MDLNYLLSRHQISLMRADMATTHEVRHAHRGLAVGYADAIRSMQVALGGGIPLTGAR